MFLERSHQILAMTCPEPQSQLIIRSAHASASGGQDVQRLDRGCCEVASSSQQWRFGFLPDRAYASREVNGSDGLARPYQGLEFFVDAASPRGFSHSSVNKFEGVLGWTAGIFQIMRLKHPHGAGAQFTRV